MLIAGPISLMGISRSWILNAVMEVVITLVIAEAAHRMVKFIVNNHKCMENGRR